MRTHTKLTNRCVFIALSVGLASISMVDVARSEFWYEDFTDGNLNDSGIEWLFVQEHSILSDGLLLSTPDSGPTAAHVDWPADRQGWSIRTQGRLLQEHGFFGAGTQAVPGQNSGGTWNAIEANGEAALGSLGFGISDWVATDLRPFEDDVIVQLETLNGLMLMWAWRVEDPPTENMDPLIVKDFDMVNAAPSLWARSDAGPSSALFQWIAISTEHMPVNLPVPLSDLIGDFSGNDNLEIADIDLLTAQIVAGPPNGLGFDLSGDGSVDDVDLAKWRTDAAAYNGFGEAYLVGDANLDGHVDAADLNRLALNWGGDVSRWSAGDFNADGSVNALDLNAVALNWGRSSPSAAASAPVPEPSAWLLALVGLTLLRSFAGGLRTPSSKRGDPMPIRPARMALSIVAFIFCQMSPKAGYAEVTFFTQRADWEAEANNRGLSFAEEDFNGFQDTADTPLGSDIPPFTVGEVRFDPRLTILQDGKLFPGLGAAVRFGGGPDWYGTIEGPIGGIGMDLDVPENAVRLLNVWPCPFPDLLCEGSDYGPFASERHLGDGFIGVLFDSPSQLEWFVFGGSGGFNSADNLVVASFPVPEPSTLSLIAAAVLTLGLLRHKRSMLA